MTTLPDAWYNVLPDLGTPLPRDVSAARRHDTALTSKVPMALVRQEMSQRPQVPIPAEVLERYREWRPTPLRRARAFERDLGTRSRIYFKYEGGNLSGSHKLNTAIPQAFHYRASGATRLTVGTGAGQWGTAVAAACAMFGMACRVYMVRSSYESKPYRKTIMEMLGAEVIPSPSPGTEAGARALRENAESGGSLSLAMAEALEDSAEPGTCFCTGSGETYSLLHQTVTGLEAREQLEEIGDAPDVVLASLGGGSNLGGIALPFIGEMLRGERAVRCVAVEPTACPKLTRGRYAYDYTDAAGLGPMQKMYTLGHTFAAPGMHAGGLRYHGTAKVVSALYEDKLLEAVAYPQRAVFESAARFCRSEGLVPAPESAHAVHGAVQEAHRADEVGESRAILICLSGHGLFDMAAYQSFLSGSMVDSTAPDEKIMASLAALPQQPASD